jgi:hypothetical protein
MTIGPEPMIMTSECELWILHAEAASPFGRVSRLGQQFRAQRFGQRSEGVRRHRRQFGIRPWRSLQKLLAQTDLADPFAQTSSCHPSFFTPFFATLRKAVPNAFLGAFQGDLPVGVGGEGVIDSGLFAVFGRALWAWRRRSSTGGIF